LTAREKRNSKLELINGKINWNHGWANGPELELKVDYIPHLAELAFTRKGDCFSAEKDGFVQYFYWHEPSGQQSGFGGWNIEINLIDGSSITLKGPWSSRCQVMNKMGFQTSVEALLIDKDKKRLAGSVTLEWLKRYINLVDPKFVPAQQMTGDLFVPQLVKTRLIYNPITYTVNILGEDAMGKLYEKNPNSDIELFRLYRPVLYDTTCFPESSTQQIDVI
jgi:hypothetical protein